VAQHDDLKLTLTTAAGEHADNPAKEPIQHTRQHDAQSEPARPGSPTRRPDRNRISLPHTIHAAFLAAPGEYDAWKERLADRGVTLIDEIAWDSGVCSCYFNDPAGYLLEIAERDLWPE
jgi:catechol 2,3-dioxygenase-like lactoylglutathione lyase family enzyme